MPRKVVICAGIAAYPISGAGIAWFYLQWILGFRELGWDVWVVEELRPDKCVDENWKPCAFEGSANRRHWESIMRRFGLEKCSSLLVGGSAPNFAEAQHFANDADIFLNISGHFKNRDLPTPRAKRIYLDLDPGFTQIWAEVYKSDMNFAGHDAFFTVGTRLGEEGCRAPTCGIHWQPTLPPVALKYWPFELQASFQKFSTVAHWHGYSWCEWQGEWYKGKSEEFTKFVELPKHVNARLEIATEVTTQSGELNAFRDAGWNLVEAKSVCDGLESCERYIRESSAEFSAAKGGYIVSQGGWFSDRSVCYLASGRPVVLQETGISHKVPTGAGLHTFLTLEEATKCCRQVAQNFEAEQRAARKLAETHFASDVVIPKMLERLAVAR